MNWIKRTLAFLIIPVLFIPKLSAGEGMWLPIFLKSLNEAEMQSMGMKISAEDIYSINQGSLKDAIVHFGGFCTSEIISDQGLLLTNHHCGYGQIQSHSSLQNNYLKNGFWAKNKSEELANPGLTATFIDKIIDVTDIVLSGVGPDLTEKERQSTIDKNISGFISVYELENYQDVYIRPFYHGNQYFAFQTTTYSDVRLVGAPPESIGKFGSDTDNWVWPRHTGDFALFRIYAGPNNLPAEYSENNVPYKPKHSLPISLDGVSEGDFTMVFGFPGRTSQYLPSAAVNSIIEEVNPPKISIRQTALDIVDKYMRADEGIRIQYASKFARIANYWKKWIGETSGLVRTNALDKKIKFESDFIKASKAIDKSKGAANKQLLDRFNSIYKQNAENVVARDYYQEITSRNVELLRIGGYMVNLVNRFERGGAQSYNAYLNALNARVFNAFYKDYRPEVDEDVFAALAEKYASELDQKYVPNGIRKATLTAKGEDYAEAAEILYQQTAFVNEARTKAILAMSPAEAVAEIKSDLLVQFMTDWKAVYDKEVAEPFNVQQKEIDSLQRVYMQELIEVFPDKRIFPDANSTMRITYGNVDGYNPADAIYYKPLTYLDGVIAKYKPGDYEFDVSPKLLELHANKDYGQYTDETGSVPVCFLGSNHTTGGNSGSPAIDAFGNLVGLNFDRVWEGTMSDINYDKSICRNIMVDARYILFIVDKYAGATHLIDEMKLVHPKNK